MPFIVGLLPSAAVAVFARTTDFDRDRAFYPTVLIVAAHYYVLFAAMGAPGDVLLLEAVVMAGFVGTAVAGFKSSTWIVVGGLAGHGVFDLLRGDLLVNAGCQSGGHPSAWHSMSGLQPSWPGSPHVGVSHRLRKFLEESANSSSSSLSRPATY